MVTVRIGDDTLDLSWEQWEERVREGRIPADALVRFAPVTGSHFLPARRLEMYRSLSDEARIAWQGAFKSGPPPLATAFLVGIQARLYWLAWLPEVEYEVTLYFTNWTAPALEDGQVWRLITMGFTHTDTFHLLLNMLWLAYTGWNLERALGWKNLVTLYLASVAGGSLLSMYGSAMTRSLGASGGVFGLVAASVFFGFARPEMLPERGRRVFGWAMLPYLVVMFWSGLRNTGTDNWSHFGGLLVGAVLVLFLDPEPLQRRVNWNRWVRAASLTGVAALLAFLGIAGPRAYLLTDSDEALQAALVRKGRKVTPPPRDAYRSVEYQVPIGWGKSVLSTGDLGFASPSPFGQRGWAVQELKKDRPRDPEAIRSHWTEQLLRSAPDAAVGPLAEAVVAGHPGWAATVTLDDDGERTLEWRFATRGVFELHEIWETDRARAERLAPLAGRLRAAVAWNEPEALVLARDGVERRPGRWSERTELASALAEWGEAELARDMWLALLADRPDDLEALRGILRVVRWYPEIFQDPLQVVSDALEHRTTPKLLREVSDTLVALERDDLAIGLMEIAWTQNPGNGVLRQVRRGLDLPSRATALHPDSRLPWNVAMDPLTFEPRSEEEIAALRLRPLTLPAAADAHSRWSAERAGLERLVLVALADPESDLITPMLLVRFGYLPEDPADGIERLLSDAELDPDDRPWPALLADAWTPAATNRLTAAREAIVPLENPPEAE